MLASKEEKELKILVIPDVHLKPWMFERAAGIMNSGAAEKTVCLMDIPDEWGQQWNVDLYIQTFDKAIWYQKTFPDTLWCYGNHDLSYVWGQPESGFSSSMMPIVNEKLTALKRELPDESQMTYIHKLDNVLFMHGGLTHAFVKRYASDVDYDDTDAVVEKINSLGMLQMWDDASPIWFRPQFYFERMYRKDGMLQVVGHTPVQEFFVEDNVLSCDVFSTYRTLKPIGTQEFLLIDTKTLEYEGVK